jgi:hypothetical protein
MVRCPRHEGDLSPPTVHTDAVVELNVTGFLEAPPSRRRERRVAVPLPDNRGER